MGLALFWPVFREKVEVVIDFVSLGSEITADSDSIREFKKVLASWKESCDKPRQCIRKQRHHFADKGLYNQSYGFSSSHVQM